MDLRSYTILELLDALDISKRARKSLEGIYVNENTPPFGGVLLVYSKDYRIHEDNLKKEMCELAAVLELGIEDTNPTFIETTIIREILSR